MNIYSNVCREINQLITNRYSTSFSMGIRMFAKELRAPIYAIYGFVRFADEIVDTFHEHNKGILLQEFREDTFKAISKGISLNPVLHSFQEVVNEFDIDNDLIVAFLDSMEMDLVKTIYTKEELDTYIYGSAEVIGLMCLKVFVKGDIKEYERLKPLAMALGSAFQKINFLRDMKSDFQERGRVYFPHINYHLFNDDQKKEIEADILKEFELGYEGIIQLPKSARLGVYCAYKYYINLFYKIQNLPASVVTDRRIRVSDKRKLYLLTTSAFQNQFGML